MPRGLGIAEQAGRAVMGMSWFYGERDYRAIEDALMRSDYGRWFLGEYLARNRSDETQALLEALERLEDSLGSGVEAEQVPRLREIALEIDAALDEAIACMADATEHPQQDAPPIDTILEAVEDINGFLEAMAARQVHKRLPVKIRARLSDIQSACAQVDTRSQAAPGLIEMLKDLRARLREVGAALESAHTEAGEGETAQQFPRKLLDELAAAFGHPENMPARG